MPDLDEAYDYWVVPAVEEAEETERSIGDSVGDVWEYINEIRRLKAEYPWVTVKGGGVMTDTDPEQVVNWVTRHKTMEEAMAQVVTDAGGNNDNSDE